jgi:hypothetical protein
MGSGRAEARPSERVRKGKWRNDSRWRHPFDRLRVTAPCVESRGRAVSGPCIAGAWVNRGEEVRVSVRRGIPQVSVGDGGVHGGLGRRGRSYGMRRSQFCI